MRWGSAISEERIRRQRLMGGYGWNGSKLGLGNNF
jgi:hypothetical protein